jgi:3-hydroxyanthranilate 3,4-dioxygenase
MALPPPVNLSAWIEAHREQLRPPVGNARVFEERGFIVMAVAGPNLRKDFHVDEGPELFFQLEGDIVLRVVDEGEQREVTIREGELFLLPPRVPHSPQRPAGTVGLVVERTRRPGELDGFLWFCDACGFEVHRTELTLTDITTQLAELFEHFWADEDARTCPRCGAILESSS